MGEHGNENAPIVGAVINNENSFHGSSLGATSVQPTGVGITYFELVKPRKRKLWKIAFGNPKGSTRTEAQLVVKTARETTRRGTPQNICLKPGRHYPLTLLRLRSF